jgi:hypothetical protein
MLFQKLNGLFHRLNGLKSAIFDLFDVTEMSHDFHQEFLVSLGIRALWQFLDSLVDIFDEVVNILNLFHCVIKQEASIGVDPPGNGVVKLLDQWVHIYTEPSNVD